MMQRPSVIQAVIGLVAFLAILFIVWFFFIRPGQLKEEAARARAGEIVAEGQLGAQKDAVEIVTDSIREEMEREKQLDEGEALIRAARDEHERDCAALRLLCRESRSGQPACVQLHEACPE